VAIAAAVGIVALLAVLYLWVLPRRAAAPAAKAAPMEQPEPAGSSAGRHPLAKHLEVSGVRIQEGASGAVKIQFLVTNHSAADLPAMKMNVALRAGDRSFFEFPVALPSIGPYESRELNSSVKTELKPYEMPDWQAIRPQFQLVTEP
jgi:hypothetical protein